MPEAKPLQRYHPEKGKAPEGYVPVDVKPTKKTGTKSKAEK